MEKEKNLVNMSTRKFLIQISILYILVIIIESIFGTELDSLKQTALGWATVTTGFLALGWYWTRICEHIEAKIKGVK
jgi:hypothetical protein